MKTIDINKINFNGDLHENLKYLHKNYKKFIIKHNKTKLACIIKILTIKTNGHKFYSIYSENKNYDRYIFKIDFYDDELYVVNTNSLIQNIQRTEKISGSDIVKLVLQLQKKLGVAKTLLSDGASVKCGNVENDLSFIKLLEKKRTFYMNFGFEFDVSIHDKIEFPNKTAKKQYVMNLIDKCRKLKVLTIINFYKKVLKMLTKTKCNIKFIRHLRSLFINGDFKITQKSFDNAQQILKIKSYIKLLKQRKIKYFYKMMVWFFNNKCEEYQLFMDMINDFTYKINNITFTLFENFQKLKYIKNSSYSKEFLSKN